VATLFVPLADGSAMAAEAHRRRRAIIWLASDTVGQPSSAYSRSKI